MYSLVRVAILGLQVTAVPALAHQAVPPMSAPTTVQPVVIGRTERPLLRTPDLATGIAGSTLDSPFSTTSVPAPRVRDQAVTTLQDALRNLPGAQSDLGFNGSHTQFFILRGAITDSGTGSNRAARSTSSPASRSCQTSALPKSVRAATRREKFRST